MSVLSAIVVSGLVGAVIGALTNEIAIICIFRVLIPGKKREMAVAVRDVVAEELMAPEKVAEKIRSAAVRQTIEQNLRSLLDRFLETHHPSPNRLLSDYLPSLDSVPERIEAFIVEESCANLLHPENFRASVIPLIDTEIGDLLGRCPEELVPSLPGLARSIPERTHAFLLSDGCQERFTNTFFTLSAPFFESDQPLSNLLPPSIIGEISDLFSRQAPIIAERIADFLETPESQSKMRHAIRSALDNYVSRKTPTPMKQGGKLLGDLLGFNLGETLMRATGIDTEITAICQSFPETVRSDRKKDGIRSGMKSMIGLHGRNSRFRALVDCTH
jgi:hypothetical protein